MQSAIATAANAAMVQSATATEPRKTKQQRRKEKRARRRARKQIPKPTSPGTAASTNASMLQSATATSTGEGLSLVATALAAPKMLGTTPFVELHSTAANTAMVQSTTATGPRKTKQGETSAAA
jgi:hypothetical protein